MRPGYAKRTYEGLKEQYLKIIKDLDYTGRCGGEGQMEKKVLRGWLILVVCAILVVSVVSVFVLHSEDLIGVLYGAVGVALFMLLAKVLSLIQKEGKQDD